MTPQHFLPPEISQEPAAEGLRPSPLTSVGQNSREHGLSCTRLCPPPRRSPCAKLGTSRSTALLGVPYIPSARGGPGQLAWEGWALSSLCPGSAITQDNRTKNGLVQALPPCGSGAGPGGDGSQPPADACRTLPSKAGPSPQSALSPSPHPSPLPLTPGTQHLGKLAQLKGLPQARPGCPAH